MDNLFLVGTISNARWADEAQTEIACMATFPSNPNIPPDGIPFTAMASDPEAHGQQIFADLIAGVHGLIGPYVAAVLTPGQLYAAAIAEGLVVTSTTTPALNGTYGVSATDQANIRDESQFISIYGEFSNGQATSSWADTYGAQRAFASTAPFMAFAKAAMQYVSACKQTLNTLNAGSAASFPVNTVDIG
jgi:hypothetical protein